MSPAALPSGGARSLADGPRGFRGRYHAPGSGELDGYAGASGPVTLRPRAAAIPADADDVVRVVRFAGEARIPLIPRGAATGMPGGNVGPGLVVDLTAGFRTVGDVDRERRTIRVGAGAVAEAVDRAAREAGLFLPPLPSSADRCTVGGMVANDAAGARSFKYGSVDEWVAGVECILADGRRVRLGGGSGDRASLPLPELDVGPDGDGTIPGWPEVKKNSSGYALDRYRGTGDPMQLVVGSEGTLAVVTEVELRLAPEPSSRGLVLLGLPALDVLPRVVDAGAAVDASACEFFGRRFLELARRSGDPHLEALPPDVEALALVEVDGGDPEEVEENLRALEDRADALGLPARRARAPRERERLWSIRHAASPTIAASAREGLVSMQFIEDSVVPPARLLDYLRSLDEILGEAGFDAVIFGHAGDANVHVNPLVPVDDPGWRSRVRAVLDATTDLVAELGGTLTGEHGDGRLRAPLLRRIWSPEIVAAFKEVKGAFDPGGVLNPGVILPLPGQDPLEGLGPE